MAANTLHASLTGVMRGYTNNTGVNGTASELATGDIRQGLAGCDICSGLATGDIRQGLTGCDICPGLAGGDVWVGLACGR